MKIISCGFPRTGTTSLKVALKTLGFTPGGVYKFDDPDAEIFVGDYNCLPTDKYKKLDGLYPDAKFILTLRENVTVWYASLCRWAKKHEHHEGLRKQRNSMYGAEMPQEYFKHIYMDHWYGVTEYFQNTYGLDYDHKLLVVNWERGDGWERLCEFLNVDVPNKPFPHKNKSK